MSGAAPDEAAVTALEASIADAGALLVRFERYRGGGGPAARLRRDALLLGDEARALHRRGGLDGDAARTLLARARELGARIEAALAAVRAAPEYAAAVQAIAAADREQALRLLPEVFAGLVKVPTPAALYQALAWRRRGRPRAVPDLVAEVIRARDEGLAPEGDDLSRGADGMLPAVVLLDTPPDDEPAVLRVDGARIGARILRLDDTDEYLVHVPALRALAGVRVADELPEDELEASPVDYGRFRADLIAALERAGVPVTTPS
ncbi:MAG TPA: hypothetical protein VFC77_00795 [Myxococcota bacterium]|nr:hypothetical protein [Myxococcota bacterium]